MQLGQVVRVEISRPQDWYPPAVVALNGKTGVVKAPVKDEYAIAPRFYVTFFEPAKDWGSLWRYWNTLLLGPFEGQDMLHGWEFTEADLVPC